MSDTCFLYAIYRKETPNKKYYGITKNIKRRWKEHISKTSDCPKIKNAIQKHGYENFKHIMLFRGTRERCFELEQYFISRYDTTNTGYNMTFGGEGSTHNEETRRKISQSHTGKIRGPHSDVHKQRISKGNTGKKRTAEQNEANRQRMTGKFVGEQHPMATMTNEKAKEIKHFINIGYKNIDISRILNVRTDIVCKIRCGKIWVNA